MVAARARFPEVDSTERLHTRCLFCGGAFPHTVLAGRVPPGACLAYDPERGRIWSICERCRRWNLIPLEDRFDAVAELERAVHDRAQRLAATANVSLYQCDDLSIVRLGPAPLVERIAWRYGRDLIARNAAYGRRRTRIASFTAEAVARASDAFGGWRLDRYWGPSDAADFLRWQRFGTVAWTGRTPCPYCESVLHTLHFDSSWWLHPRLDGDRLVIGVPCTRCDPWTPRNVFDVTGDDAYTLLRRALAYQHIAGASERAVSNASALIEHAGSAGRLLAQLSSGRRSLWGLGPVRSLALEIAVSHLVEERRLTSRLEAWEAEWRLEEPLARIIDHELS